MLFKASAQKIHVYAYDSTTGAAKAGDAANITAYVSLDGTANAVDDLHPAEVEATYMPGVYVFDLTAAETNCDSFAMYAKSATASIRLDPIIGFTSASVNQSGDTFAALPPYFSDVTFPLGGTIFPANAANEVTVATANTSLDAIKGTGFTGATDALHIIGPQVGEVLGDLDDYLVPGVTLANGAHGGAAATITLQTPIAASGNWNVGKTGYALAASQHVIVDSGEVTTVTTLTSLPAAPTNWLTGAAVHADAVTKIQNGLATPINITAASGVVLTAAYDAAKTAASQTSVDDVPTVTEFNARTLAAANYFDPAADVVAHVTLVDTTTTNTDMRGTNNAALAATALSNVTWTDAKAAFVDAAISGGTGLTAAETRAALGMTIANLDTQLAAVAKTGADSDTLETLSDQVDALVASSGLTAQQTRDALKLAPTAGAAAAGSIDAELDAIIAGQVTISPLAATVSAGAVAFNTLTAYQYMDLGPFVWTCLDSAGTAINLSGHTVYLSVFDPGVPAASLWSVLGVVTGASSNIVTVSQADTNTGTAGAYAYRLVDTTDDIMLDTGSLTIIEGPNVVTPV